MESILRCVSLEPVPLTYVGIGSSPHLGPEQELDAKYDQLIPSCFHEFLVKDKLYMRIIHFDPDFERCLEFLNKYFEKWNLTPIDFSEGYSWIGEHLEVIVIPQMVSHTDHYWFFQGLCEGILQTKGKLVIQQYTGDELLPLNTKLYEESPNKELFKKRALLDMTYGTDCGCCTDMTKSQPFYDYDLNFLNLHFMTDEDAKRWIGISLKLDDILKKKYLTRFLQSLNNIHVDYRRKLRGDPIMFGSPKYTDTSTADEIMNVLQNELSVSFEILVKTNYLEREMLPVLQDLFHQYKSYDPYKWYEAVKALLPPP